ncbi:unnamed protein product [Timema podura]|uniref:Piwi domain-containing protein n=1 Tax=Timema podura TaxID=61482 RepID=A0ABN7P1I0_TIMPD|nr:unnamed protein product [Timema podura]
MIVGFDVCHDTTDKGKSYGAMVASLNKSLSRYFSAVSAHTSGEELSSHLAANMTMNARNIDTACAFSVLKALQIVLISTISDTIESEVLLQSLSKCARARINTSLSGLRKSSVRQDTGAMPPLPGRS